MSITGYEKVGATVVAGRALEARALTRAAMALNDAMTRGDDIALVEAVTMNYRLWLFFYSEIESGRVSLPADVAGNIITLVGYVVKVAPRACAGERKVIETLISINRNIAAGLSEGAANTPEPSALPAGETTTFSASV